MEIYGIPLVVFFGIFASLYLGGGVSVVYTVYADALARGAGNATAWGLVSFVFPPAALVYWFGRSKYGPRSSRPTHTEVVARALAVGVGGAVLVDTLFLPPDPVTQVLFGVPVGLGGSAACYVAQRWRRPRHTRPQPRS